MSSDYLAFMSGVFVSSVKSTPQCKDRSLEMSVRRRLVPMATLAATTAAVLAVPVTAAHAATTPPAKVVGGSMNIFISDEDSPDPDDEQSFSVALGARTLQFGTSTEWVVTRCVDEVRVVTVIDASYRNNLENGVQVPRVFAQARSSLFEGASCSTTDWDGFGGANDKVVSTSGTPFNYTVVNSSDEYDFGTPTSARDFAQVSFTVNAK
ncbi:hypothetical protein KV205_31400 [Streptomyces sp. SKN60]|nr:hypothetical protein [Streptomyces sp. SKN60]